jgi:hypothetical protein
MDDLGVDASSARIPPPSPRTAPNRHARAARSVRSLSLFPFGVFCRLATSRKHALTTKLNIPLGSRHWIFRI